MVKHLDRKVFSQYLKARHDYLLGQYKSAIQKLVSLNIFTKNHDVNHLLVKCLYHQKDYRSAEQVLLDDVNSYTDNISLTNLMINVLLKNNEFIMCHEIISSFQDVELKNRLNETVNHRELFIKKHQSKRVEPILKAFYHLSNYSLIRQRQVLRDAQRLPLNQFINVAKDLLVDPFLVPIMRLTILDVLRKVDFKGLVRYRWINNQVYSINVKDLVDLTATWSYRQIMRIIKSKYSRNPNQMIALEQNIRLDLSYLYPFNDQKIVYPKLWVKVAAIRLHGEQPIFINSKIKNVYLLQVKLNQLTKNLLK